MNVVLEVLNHRMKLISELLLQVEFRGAVQGTSKPDEQYKYLQYFVLATKKLAVPSQHGMCKTQHKMKRKKKKKKS